MTLGSNGAIKRALGIGLGLTLISAHAVARELRDGQLVRIPARGSWFVRRWNVLLSRTLPPRPAVEAFRVFLHSDAARRAIEQAL